MCAVKMVLYLQNYESSASALTLLFKSIVVSVLMAINTIIFFTHKASSGFQKEPNVLPKDFLLDHQRSL